jgi:3-dehydroquinate synthase
LYGRPLSRRLHRAGCRADYLSFPGGERNKSRRTKAALEDRLADLRVGRDGALVAVGGGVALDLVGFLAATWQRGIPVVQVPTSLLAMVDAAVGGKTAVNLAGWKNQLGSFHHPWGVYADVSVLSSLPTVEFRNGLAEVVKTAVVSSASFFRWLELEAASISRRDPERVEQLVQRSVSLKSALVRRDERDSGPRMALNFGHTIGHAIETVSRHRIPHGRAVAIGMCLEARLAERLGPFPERDLARLVALLRGLGLPTQLPRSVSVSALIEATRHDKKVAAGRVRFALPLRVGRMPRPTRVTTAVAPSALRRALRALPDE